MATQYAQIEDCLDVVDFLLQPQGKSELLKASLFGNLLEASRQFERETFAEEDFYSAISVEFDKNFSLQRGKQMIFLPPFSSLTAVHDVNDDEIDLDGIELLRDVWGYYGIRIRTSRCASLPVDYIRVTAFWGWKCIPSDVTFAVKCKGLLSFLTNPTNRKGLNIKLTDEQSGRFINDYNRIVRQWNLRNKNFYQGIGIG